MVKVLNESENNVTAIVGGDVEPIHGRDAQLKKVRETFASSAAYEQERGRDIRCDVTCREAGDGCVLSTGDIRWANYVNRLCAQLAAPLKRRHGIRITWDVTMSYLMGDRYTAIIALED